MSDRTIFLCGDVMTGRGIDQIMRCPGNPTLFEGFARSALDYVELAEARNGQIPRRVEPDYIWGDSLPILARARPSARIINLETAITETGDPWPGKGIHYRMHPDNADCLTVAGIDCCALANNHVLDWSRPGLDRTLVAVERAGARPAGAGRDAISAAAPALIDTGDGSRVLVVSLGAESSGISRTWGATPGRSGVNLVSPEASDVESTADALAAARRPGDIAVASIHWGSNWGYRVPGSHRHFAHDLIDRGVDVVHGHSSHHPLGIEVYRGRLILYGCGDLINDYEGIEGHERYRPDMGLLYLATVDDATGLLAGLELVPMKLQRFRLHLATGEEMGWMARTLSREGERFGTTVVAHSESLSLSW